MMYFKWWRRLRVHSRIASRKYLNMTKLVWSSCTVKRTIV